MKSSRKNLLDDLNLRRSAPKRKVVRQSDVIASQVAQDFDTLHASRQRRRAHLEEYNTQAVDVHFL